MKTRSITLLEKISYAVLLILLVYGIYLARTNQEAYAEYIAEDHFVEYLTAILLFVAGLIQIFRLIKKFGSTKMLWKVGVLVSGLLFIFGGGEEVSWGQRIFDIQSSEYFMQNNAQNETNLHNLVVGDTKINKLIFGKIMVIILAIYVLFVPLLYRKYEWSKNLLNKFAVPVVEWQHSIAFVLSTVLVMSIGMKKQWELYELAFGVIFLLIFLNPFNKKEIDY